MNAHTPGPWRHVKAERLSHDAPGFDQIVSPGGILGGTPEEPCWVIDGEIDYEPDARLIAAAPRLLKALKWLLHETMFKDHPEASQEAIDAIAEAEAPEPASWWPT